MAKIVGYIIIISFYVYLSINSFSFFWFYCMNLFQKTGNYLRFTETTPHFAESRMINMGMGKIWTFMVIMALVGGLAFGRGPDVASAAMDGARSAIELCIQIAGILCLWSGVMEIMKQSGLSSQLSSLLRPVIKRLFPTSARDESAISSISQNISANILGLGNAATPPGIDAAQRLTLLSGREGSAGNDLCMLVVLNTASIQLIPATVAGIRQAQGSAAPFDMLPAVWIASAISVTVGVVTAKLLSRVWGDA